MPTQRPLPILMPERIRSIPKSFAWIDHRLRSGGFLQNMSEEETAFYSFLALAADQRGLSCWRLDRMEREIHIAPANLRQAREGLIRKDLLAFKPWYSGYWDGSYQLLSLPSNPPVAPRGLCQSLGEILEVCRQEKMV